MRQLAFALGLVLSFATFHDALAQDFYYVPPGGYGYGIDLGNGFGYGYGFGYGLTDSPDTLAANALTEFARSQVRPQGRPQETTIDTEVLNADVPPNWQSLAAATRAKQRALRQQRDQAAKDAMVHHREQQKSHPVLHQPARLTREQFDSSTGKVLWPSALLRDTFADQRTAVETLLKTRPGTGNLGEVNASVSNRIQEMVRGLRGEIRRIGAMEYLEGQRFLTNLDREVRSEFPR